jgi:hypothetical protein
VEGLFAFSEYDLIAYLMVGLAALIVFDFVLHTHFIFRGKWTTGTMTGVLILAYIIGHLVSIPSEFFLEELLAKDALGSPVSHLMPDKPCAPHSAEEGISWHTFVPIYYYFVPASHNICISVKNKEPRIHDKELFSEAFAAAKQDTNSYERMTIFQRLYILFRNMTMVSIFACFVLFPDLVRAARARCEARRLGKPEPAAPAVPHDLIEFGVQPWLLNPVNQFWFFAVLSIGLLDRYIYFYFLYSYEVISAFAYGATVLE